jgi:superfamily II DNA or RNA helicase
MPQLQIIAKRNLQVCREVQLRISSGIDALEKNNVLFKSFQLANYAMSVQHSWKSLDVIRPLRWRPFQLGFILLSAESVCVGESPDREIFDLLWFPTGGGKTEAYLALVAMLAFYRRLSSKDPDTGAGNAAVMRYTLRLLTAQQFERAASLILACDLIRSRRIGDLNKENTLGKIPISIGLWVGGEATPNNYSDAAANRGARGLSTAEQISECPCCHDKIHWNYNELNESVSPYCENSNCSLGPDYGLWPVYTIDNMIYRERPTLLIGTIDKFALITTRQEVSSLFGFGTSQSTDLIIQDELHLISGPLGTIAGLYEMAFDWLLRKGNVRPKIIGSTATIRRASEQVRALFDRDSCQFPPPGLDHDDSGFAVKDADKAPRMYLGITTAGRSAKFVLQAAAASLLQSASSASVQNDQDRDGYATMLAYFNSLRELGGAIVQMLDDVPDSIRLYSDLRNELIRQLGPPRELTSRVSQKEIVEILSELKIAAGMQGAIDTVLATNMVSVGVDVSRLGMMLMNGQPKTRSEYIQATSRVGRSVFPGLVITILNSAKPRDRSHFETFLGWHSCLYKDVEATSVTPFASRSRDRALHAALVAMVRHGTPTMLKKPNLHNAPNDFLAGVAEEIERRVNAIDPSERDSCAAELDELLQNWEEREPVTYSNSFKPNTSLLISADINAQRKASGRLPANAWPTMNNMRSVEATTRFRMAEFLTDSHSRNGSNESLIGATELKSPSKAPRWRRINGQ